MRTFLYILAAILAVGCGASAGSEAPSVERIDNPHDGLWQDAHERPFRLVLEQTFGAEEEPVEALIGGISGVAVDGDGNVYITDNRSHRLLSFDRDGAFRWAVGREGEGPGEFKRPYAVGWDGRDRLYITNQNSTRLEIYDLGGNYLDTNTFESLGLNQAELVGFLDPEKMVLSWPRGGIGVDVSVVSLEDRWDVINTIPVRQPVDDGFPQVMLLSPDVSILDGDIVVGRYDSYRLDTFSPKGMLHRITARDVDTFFRPTYRGTGPYTVLPPSQVYAPIEVAGGYRLVWSIWTKNIRSVDSWAKAFSWESLNAEINGFSLDLYDSDWKLLYSWEEERARPQFSQDPPFGFLFMRTVDAVGKFYAELGGDYPQVGRIRVEIDTPSGN